MTPVIVLYRRPACGLCDEAERILGPLVAELGATFEPRDVTADPRLFDRLGMAIPVVEVDGVEVARAPLRAGTLIGLVREAVTDRAPAQR